MLPLIWMMTSNEARPLPQTVIVPYLGNSPFGVDLTRNGEELTSEVVPVILMFFSGTR